LIQDRFLSIQAAKYVFNNMRDLSEEISFRPDGFIPKRAAQVLDEAIAMLERIDEVGLMQALANGWFAEIKRAPDGGKGLGGVVRRESGYLNPFIPLMLQGGESR